MGWARLCCLLCWQCVWPHSCVAVSLSSALHCRMQPHNTAMMNMNKLRFLLILSFFGSVRCWTGAEACAAQVSFPLHRCPHFVLDNLFFSRFIPILPPWALQTIFGTSVFPRRVLVHWVRCNCMAMHLCLPSYLFHIACSVINMHHSLCWKAVLAG